MNLDINTWPELLQNVGWIMLAIKALLIIFMLCFISLIIKLFPKETKPAAIRDPLAGYFIDVVVDISRLVAAVFLGWMVLAGIDEELSVFLLGDAIAVVFLACITWLAGETLRVIWWGQNYEDDPEVAKLRYYRDILWKPNRQ